MYYLLFYHTIDNYVEKRAPFRDQHLSLLNQEVDNNHVVLGGALADPADQAIIVWKVDNVKIIEDFVANDPYVKQGLISRYEIRPWKVVINSLDSNG